MVFIKYCQVFYLLFYKLVDSDVAHVYLLQVLILILEPAIGKHEPHQNLPVYKTIGKKLDSIL